MDEQTIDFRDIFDLVLRNAWVIALCVIVCSAIGFGLALMLPKQYKSKSVLSIQASYFQNPLVSNLITDVYDPSELRAERQSLLQLALSPEFLEELGEKHSYFLAPAGTELRNLEKEQLLKAIEYFPLGQSAFQISVLARERQQSFEMTKTVLQRMIDTLISERTQKLMATRQAIEGHITTLGKVLRTGESGAAQNAEVLKMELEKIEGDMAVLLQHFTERHPEVVKLRHKAEALRSRLDHMPKRSPEQEIAPAIFMTQAAQRPVREVHDDMLKKLSNIDIVLNIEKDRKNLTYLSVVEQPVVPAAPIFPNKRMFLLFGALAGAMLAAVTVMFLELRRGTFVSPYYISDQLEMPLLGELPYHEDGGDRLLLLDSLSARSAQRLLPQFDNEIVAEQTT